MQKTHHGLLVCATYLFRQSVTRTWTRLKHYLNYSIIPMFLKGADFIKSRTSVKQKSKNEKIPFKKLVFCFKPCFRTSTVRLRSVCPYQRNSSYKQNKGYSEKWSRKETEISGNYLLQIESVEYGASCPDVRFQILNPPAPPHRI
jgi:hypothetical protein